MITILETRPKHNEAIGIKRFSIKDMFLMFFNLKSEEYLNILSSSLSNELPVNPSNC